MEMLPGPSLVRQNYYPECEAAVNNRINLHFHASYVYSSMAFYFNREDVALKHFSQFFLQRSNKEKEHTERLMQLQNQRRGRIHLRDISSPPWHEWESGWRAMQCTLHLVKKVNQSPLPEWRERVFLGTMENAELIFSLETMWCIVVGCEVDGIGQ